MKSIEQVRISTILNSVALVLNIVLNATFIFGWIPGIRRSASRASRWRR